MEILLIILIMVAVVGMTAMVFCVWAVMSLARGAWRLLFGKSQKPSVNAAGTKTCGNTQCECVNPAQARFCRRCGRMLPGLVRWADGSTRAE